MDYPIQVVAKRTGLSAGTLRAWERRYEGITPPRDAQGRRRYPEHLVTKLSLLAALVHAGYRIGEIAALEVAELRELYAQLREVGATAVAGATAPAGSGGAASGATATPAPAHSAGPSAVDSTEAYIAEATDGVRELDDVRLYRVIEEATVVFGRLDIVDRFIFPLNKRVAGMVDVGELRSVHHGFLQAALRTVLSSLLLPSQADATRPVVLLTVPLAQRQEIGMIASAIHAYAAGWRPVLLGSGIPAEGVVEAAATTGAKAVILAVVSTRYDFGVWEELTRIRRSLDAEIPVYFGGRLPERLVDDLKEAGLQYLDDMEDLRSTLAARPA